MQLASVLQAQVFRVKYCQWFSVSPELDALHYHVKAHKKKSLYRIMLQPPPPPNNRDSIRLKAGRRQGSHGTDGLGRPWSSGDTTSYKCFCFQGLGFPGVTADVKSNHAMYPREEED